jgi:hypothetical protein
VIDPELLPLLLPVILLVLRAPAQARQEPHLSSPDSTPPAGGDKKRKSPTCLTRRGRRAVLGSLDIDQQSRTAAGAKRLDQFSRSVQKERKKRR